MTAAKILIVEDEGILAEGLKKRLTALGYTVTGIAARGEEAIAKAGQTRPDLVIMDIRLKGEMDGIEAAQVIRERFDIPVVYLTAYSDQQTLDRAKITEPYGYICKPVEERELHINIEIALYKHRTEKELLKKRELEALATFASGIAHDFRNIFNLVNGFIDVAMKESRHDPEISHHPLTKARENLARAIILVNKFLDIFQEERLNRQKINVTGLIQEAIDSVPRPNTITISLPTGIPPLLLVGDEARLKEAFSDLLVNAVEAMSGKEPGIIGLAIETVIADSETYPLLKEGRYLKVSIQDPGKGIPGEHIEKIFLPYFSTKDNPTQKGLGLGLTFCYSIIKRHGGHIAFTSSPGAGTTATVFLPLPA